MSERPELEHQAVRVAARQKVAQQFSLNRQSTVAASVWILCS